MTEQTTTLKRTLGSFRLWGIAVGLVISGEYFGWSYGWSQAGTLGFMIVALAIAATPHTARVVRASVMVVREMEYVEAARALGAGHVRTLLHHVLANAMAPLVVRVTYVFAIAILNEAVLSFIGVGPPPPIPTFGAIIANGRDFIIAAPWITVAPGMAILVSVLGLNLLGDGLRDVLDPRMTVNTR